jgi:2-polyprenyl-3-methyl-5-hydroxy-6-metoxy-1,4-benzoquinol methylase
MSSQTNGVCHKREGESRLASRSREFPTFCFPVNNNKKPKDEFRYGNYKNYYYKRLAAGVLQTDMRLELLEAHPECFRDKTVLDIGCNSGFITINFARKLLPASVLGIDIDGSLVDKARRDLDKEKTEMDLTHPEVEALKHVVFRKVRSDNCL